MYHYIDLEKVDRTKIPTEEIFRQHYYMALLSDWVKGREQELGRKMTANIQTFGCQMNARDSEKLLGILENVGFVETEALEADLVLYNTCTVRENANLKVYGRLGYIKSLKKQNPDMIVVLCGCMMQEKEVIEKIKQSYRFVNIVFGTHNIFKLAELLYQNIREKKMVIDIWKDTEQVVEELPMERKFSFKSGVNIMFGCNNFCSYCIVPYVRGRERSRTPKDILEEIRQLAKDGVMEVMLLGQNVNSYGKNLEPPVTFAELLKQVEKIDGIERIRFMTSHPKDLSEDLIEVMKHSKKICKQLHLPLQSGSSRILDAMNRKYKKEQYLKLVEKIKEEIPDISLSTDIIVGFPGETEEDFGETLDVIKRVRYDSAYTFIYSKRSNTPAAGMPEQVPEEVAKKRMDLLLEEIHKISAENTKRLEGSIQKVLIEAQNEQDPVLVTGRLDNNMVVHLPGDMSLIGKIIDVELTEAKGFYYMGKCV